MLQKSIPEQKTVPIKFYTNMKLSTPQLQVRECIHNPRFKAIVTFRRLKIGTKKKTAQTRQRECGKPAEASGSRRSCTGVPSHQSQEHPPHRDSQPGVSAQEKDH